MKFGLPTLITVSCLIYAMPSALCQSVSRHFISNGFRPVIASDGTGNLHVAFESYGKGKDVTDIYYTTSADLGAHWSKPYNLSETLGVSKHAAIAVEKSGAVDVVWADSNEEGKMPEIFFSRSSSVTHTWSAPMNISSTPGVSSEPALAIGPDDSLNIVWSEREILDTGMEIFYVSSTDGGKTWSPPRSISKTIGLSAAPTISASTDGVLYTAWSDTPSEETNPDIFYCQSQHGIWTKVVNISKSGGFSAQPSIAGNKGKVFLTWSDSSKRKPSSEIWLAVGGTVEKFDRVLDASGTTGSASRPRLAARGDDLALVWTEVKSEGTQPGIRGIASSDNGETFTKSFDISTFKDHCRNPDSTIQAGYLCTVWEEASGKDEGSLNIGLINLSRLEKGKVLPVDSKLYQGSGTR
ncbi:MAG: exo-alpha-sialidase [Cyanobacteria bacterium SZAS LIN-2]|nr:exo-alpha-sialidase [Cyanobacteria bacterium SZAS LIN-3]MBS1998977.1 exo-alpha-sialidase [Cyanobacteria bacterium SZAS LIN-2]